MPRTQLKIQNENGQQEIINVTYPKYALWGQIKKVFAKTNLDVGGKEVNISTKEIFEIAPLLVDEFVKREDNQPLKSDRLMWTPKFFKLITEELMSLLFPTEEDAGK